jgi:hypothetical protein
MPITVSRCGAMSRGRSLFGSLGRAEKLSYHGIRSKGIGEKFSVDK